MISGVGVETVTLTDKLKLVGKVEFYLHDMIKGMQKTLRDIATKSF